MNKLDDLSYFVMVMPDNISPLYAECLTEIKSKVLALEASTIIVSAADTDREGRV
jgi:hypothetical protein